MVKSLFFGLAMFSFSSLILSLMRNESTCTALDVPTRPPVAVKIDTCIGSQENGKRVGYWTCWIDGRRSDMFYIDGKIHGFERVFVDSDSKDLYIISHYRNGLRDGVQISYHPNGTPHYLTTYTKGFYTEILELDSMGLKCFEAKYLIDSIETKGITFDSETWEAIDTTSIYDLKSVPHGEWKYFRKGQHYKSLFYEKGAVVDSLVLK